MGRLGDFSRFSLRAVVAPEIVFAEWLQALVYRNDGRAGRVDGYRLDLIARGTCLLDGGTGSFCQRAHVIVVRLSGVFGIFAFAMERILSDRGGKHAAFAVYYRD